MTAGGHLLPVEYVQCESFRDFLLEMSRLRDEALQGQIPIVHIECHGDPMGGLQFANGSELSWADLAEALLGINLATQFNTLVVVSACFGSYFLGMLSAVRAAPCRGIVAPTERVFPDECEQGLKTFYGELVATWNLSLALDALKQRQLAHGSWFGELAEDWFAKIFLHYIETECRVEQAEDRLAGLRSQLEASNARWISRRDLLNQLKLTHSQALDKYFSRYFSTDRLPSVRQKFKSLKTEMASHLKELAATGKYIL